MTTGDRGGKLYISSQNAYPKETLIPRGLVPVLILIRFLIEREPVLCKRGVPVLPFDIQRLVDSCILFMNIYTNLI